MQETGRHPVIYQLPARTWRSRLFPDIIGRFQTLFRESVKFWNFDQMFGASDFS